MVEWGFSNGESLEGKTESCTILGLKSMGKLITLDKYLSVRLNQGLAWYSDSNL